jgi:hypothetical protein
MNHNATKKGRKKATFILVDQFQISAPRSDGMHRPGWAWQSPYSGAFFRKHITSAQKQKRKRQAFSSMLRILFELETRALITE